MNLNLFFSVGAVYTLAMFVQRIAGFGSGIVAIIILPYLIGSHAHTAAFTNIFSAFSSTYLALKYRQNCRWRLFVPILCGSFIATIFAVRFLSKASFGVLEKLLGAVLLILSLYFLFLKGKITIPPSRRNGFLTGLCGGTLNGLFSTGGPPVVIYLLGATAGYAEYLATIQGYFAFNNTYATLIRFLNGQIDASILPGVAGGFLGMILGNFLGGKVIKYVPDEKIFLKVIYCVMALSGIMMLL